MLENHQGQQLGRQTVSVAGCLGYDVLAIQAFRNPGDLDVSVAGCLGYDVLVASARDTSRQIKSFSCWLFRL